MFVVTGGVCLRGESSGVVYLDLYLAPNQCKLGEVTHLFGDPIFSLCKMMKLYYIKILNLKSMDMQEIHDPLPKQLAKFMLMSRYVFSGTRFSEDT